MGFHLGHPGLIKQLEKVELLILDEFVYISLHKESAECISMW